MRQVSFSSSESRVIAASRDAGVVLDFVLFDCSGRELDSEWTHRSAAVTGVQAACVASANELAANLERLLAHGRDSEEQLCSSVRAASEQWRQAGCQQTDPATLKGRRVSLRELYGDAFEASEGRFDEARIKFARDVFDPTWTLPDAFACTPYGVSLHGDALQQLWRDVVGELLGCPDVATTMYRWDGDWSPYFDAGREWWGAAVWTVRRRASELIVVCASTTD